ncbi:MAG: GAF domain-containing sensor histidine kinase [Candidatus Brocadiia bacterium]
MKTIDKQLLFVIYKGMGKGLLNITHLIKDKSFWLMAIPVIAGIGVIVIFWLHAIEEREYTAVHITLLAAFLVIIIFVALVMGGSFRGINKSYQELERNSRNLNILYQISLITNSSFELTNIMNEGLKKSIELMGLNFGGIYLFDESKGALILGSHFGLSEEYVKKVGYVEMGKGTAGEIAKKTQLQVINDLSTLSGDLQSYAIKEGLKTTVSVPLKSRDELCGIMNLTTNYIREFTSDEINMITIIGNILGDAIAQARIYNQIKKANEELTNLNHVKDNFIVTITHELRTPLMAIKEGVTLCRQRIGDAISLLDGLSFMESSVSRLIRLVNNLWDISRIESGKITLDKKKVSINNLIKISIGLLEPLINNKEISISHNLTDSLPFVFVDTDKVLQIMLNLIDNAVKFTKLGGDIIISSKQISPQFIEISVKDNGVGMTSEEAGKIFEKIPSLSEDGLGKFGVIKLGLRLCKLFVEMHGGRISVHSEQDNGSVFIFTLPIAA